MASRISSSLLLSCGASHVNSAAAAPVTALTPSQAVARDAQEWEAMATRLLASPRLLQEWKTRTRELCDSSGMWWVSWWVKRFSGTLRLSGTALLPYTTPPLLLQLQPPDPSTVDLHLAAARGMHLVGAQMKFLLPDPNE
jgi:hypothetical protein